MILLWLLCVGLVLGGLLAGLARQVPWGKLPMRRTQPVPVRVRAHLTRARGRRRRGLSRPATGPRAGPPGGNG
jgi:hypothetical protein